MEITRTTRLINQGTYQPPVAGTGQVVQDLYYQNKRDPENVHGLSQLDSKWIDNLRQKRLRGKIE